MKKAESLAHQKAENAAPKGQHLYAKQMDASCSILRLHSSGCVRFVLCAPLMSIANARKSVSSPLRGHDARMSDAVLAPSAGLDCEVSAGQPYSLSALEAVASFIADKDVSLWPCLRAGVPTGYRRNIPLSGVLIPLKSNDFDPPPPQYCTGNWSEAEKDPDLFRKLIEQEVAAGFLEEVGWRRRSHVGRISLQWASATLSSIPPKLLA